MAKVDWQGLATAIGQVNQLIQPSAVATQKMEMDSWKERTLWQHTLGEITKAQSKYEELEQKYEDKFDEVFVADASLVKGIDSKWDSGNALALNKNLGSKSLDSLTDQLNAINENTAELINAVDQISTKKRSLDFGANLSIPVSFGDENKELWQRGKPTLDADNNITGYTSWDVNNDKIISGNEASRAIPVIVNMMAESGVNIDEEAVRKGYWKAFNDEAVAQKVEKTKRANDDYIAAGKQRLIDAGIKADKAEFWYNVTKPKQELDYMKLQQEMLTDPTQMDDESIVGMIFNLNHQLDTNNMFNLDDAIFSDDEGNAMNETEYQSRLSNVRALNKKKSQYVAEALTRGIDIFTAQDFQEIYHNNYMSFLGHESIMGYEDEFIERKEGTSWAGEASGVRGSTLIFNEDEWQAIQGDPLRATALGQLVKTIDSTPDHETFLKKADLLKVFENSNIVNKWNEKQKLLYESIIQEMADPQEGVTKSELDAVHKALGL